jgi:hypothetical protein
MGSPVRPVCGRNRRRSDLTSTKPQRLGTCTCHYGHSPTSRYDARQLDLKKMDDVLLDDRPAMGMPPTLNMDLT